MYFSNEPKHQMNMEYFSGSQASIFIGEIWVDDILEWQCSLNYSAAPIYGYGSTFYDHIAEGKVLVQGTFTINFKEPNYLWAILARNNFKDIASTKDQEKVDQLTQLIENVNSSRNQTYETQKQVMDSFFKEPNSIIEKAFYNNRSFIKEKNANQNDFNHEPFDILIGYGAELNQDTPGEKITGIKLTGRSKVIYQDGNPIREQYNFFARNIV